eukprot:TRINITY_DN8722_c0_g1_i1.p2 TRINITY_DN8722_c0_g1~~TRINITY_DN8722_c0_g1_i1.p2  ORF type:complete len:154 (+),score=9.20 TRINITY_DN8722_c0_g1_i1:712-1173(+)
MAKKFKFKLQPLLQLRESKVKEAEDSLNQVLRVRYAKDANIAHKRADKEALLLEKPYSSKAIDLQARVYRKEFIEVEIKNLEEERNKLLQIEKKRRLILTEAMKEEKVIHKLKEKKKAEYDFETAMEEMKFLDELAVKRYMKSVHERNEEEGE